MDQSLSAIYKVTRPFGGIVLNLADFAHKAKAYDVQDVRIGTRLGKCEPWFWQPAHDVMWVSVVSQSLKRELTIFETTRASTEDKADYGRWVAQAHQRAFLEASGAYARLKEKGIEASLSDKTSEVVPRKDRIWFYWV